MIYNYIISLYFFRLFLTQLIESDGKIEDVSRIFLKNRNHFEIYIPYALNRQYSESTLNSYESIRKFFNVNIRKFLNFLF
jgi:hypothetical protein